MSETKRIYLSPVSKKGLRVMMKSQRFEREKKVKLRREHYDRMFEGSGKVAE